MTRSQHRQLRRAIASAVAFLAILVSPAARAASYSIVDAGSIGGSRDPQWAAVNDVGQLAGCLADARAYCAPAIWNAGTVRTLFQPSAQHFARAGGISATGALAAVIVWNSGSQSFYGQGVYDPSGTEHLLLDTNQAFSHFPSISGTGNLAGEAPKTGGTTNVVRALAPAYAEESLPKGSYPVINDAGHVAYRTGAGVGELWVNGSTTPLDFSPAGIDENDDLVGTMGTGTQAMPAFRPAGGPTQTLPVLAGATAAGTVPMAITNDRRIIGTSSGRPVIWVDGQVSPLDTLLPSGSGWTLSAVLAVSPAGNVLGWGKLNGVARFFLLKRPDALTLDVADASPRELPLFLPDGAAATSLPALDWSKTRPVQGVAADGVSLLLLRAAIHGAKPGSHGNVRFVVQDLDHGADPGSFWTPDDRSLVDDGFRLENQPRPNGPATLVASPVVDPNDAESELTFVLYRPPRDFDGGSGTSSIQKRSVHLEADLLDPSGTNVLAVKPFSLDVVRPLVVLQHGTFDSPSGWKESPLFTQTGNELRDPPYSGSTADFPFQTDRGDFSAERGAAGHLVNSAPLAWDAFNGKLTAWRFLTGYAGAQADVVCHSYGGVVMRWAAQTQQDGPLSVDTVHNFRNQTNWGHGAFHKLITIASTHRGSAVSNQLASLNANGAKPGLIREVAEAQSAWIDRGGVEDQMVVSPILQQLAETRVPGHLIAGSGWAEFNHEYESRLYALWVADSLSGPFKSLGSLYALDGSPIWGAFRMASNYGFNLGQTLVDDTTQDPNYDLTVSSYSSKAGTVESVSYVTDPFVLGLVAGRSDLAGHFTHGDEIAFGSGDPLPATAVATRVAFLLRQSTDSQFFHFFPANFNKPFTPTELAFSDTIQFDPRWLYIQTLSGQSMTRAAAPSAPTLDVQPPATAVSPGQQLQVAVSWPDQGIESGFVTWASAHAGGAGLVRITADSTSQPLTVPARDPGPFPVLAVVTSPGGAIATARVDLEIVDPTPYLELRAEPFVLTLRGTESGGVNVFGRLDADHWSELDASPRLHWSTSAATVVTVDTAGRFQPVGAGEAIVTAAYEGSPSVQIRVDVVSDTTTTTLDTVTTTSSSTTTSTTVPPCVTLRCIIDGARRGPSCGTQTLPSSVAGKLDRAITQAELAPSQTSKKARRLLLAAKHLLVKAKKATTKAAGGKHPKLSAGCASDLVNAIAAGEALVAGQR